MKPYILIVALLFSASAVAKQKFYKWTDEQGNTHYTTEKPEDKATDEVKVNTKQPVILEKSNKQTNKTPSSQDNPGQDQPEEKSYLEQRREKKQKAKEVAQENKKECQKAKQTISKYSQKVRMSRIDKKTGKKIFLEDSKRTEILKQAKQKQRKHC